VGPVALDASVAIGFLESTDVHHERAVEELRRYGGAPISMAASAYSEVLVRPLERGYDDTVNAFVEALRIEIAPIDRGIARRAAQLRSEHRRLRLPDALVLATAEASGARLLTFDERLAALQ
jgi:predicted nucleic acid-binding protein